MNSPPDIRPIGRLQSIIIRIRFTETLVRSPEARNAICDLVQKLALRLELAGIMLDEGCDAVLGLEGGEVEIDGLLAMLAMPPYRLDVEIPWRLCIAETRYRRLVLPRPVLTPGERVWLRMEIGRGFSDFGTLSTLIDWLALRQACSPPTGSMVQAPGVVSRDRSVSAEIIPFRRRSS